MTREGNGINAKHSKGDHFLSGLGLGELIIILAIIFFLSGGKRISQISRGLGRTVRNFKKGLHEPDAIDITPKKEATTSGEETPSKKPL